MIIFIGEHALHQYAKNVLDKRPEELTAEERVKIRKEITRAVIEPEEVYHEKKEMAQIHIKGRIAIPVGVDTDDNRSLGPYENLMQDLKVPTVYRDEVFRSKASDANDKAAA